LSTHPRNNEKTVSSW